MSTTKAIRATIKLGDIDLDVFQLPDGEYQMSQSQTTEAVNKPPKRMVELANSEKGQILIQSGFEKGLKVAVEGSKPVNLVPLEVAFQFWVLELAIGNQKALALVMACGVEALERRADTAFGVLRSEDERNQRLDTRVKGILSRHFWTDMVDAYMHQNEVSANYRRWVYVHVSDAVNRAIFGLSAKQVRETVGIRDNDLVRDFLPSETLKLIDTIEKAAGIRLENNQVDPKQAIKDVIALLGIEPSIDRLYVGKKS